MSRALAASLAVAAGLLTWSVTGVAGPIPRPTDQGPTPQDAPGIISGVVLDSATKQPISGAIVSLQPSRGGSALGRSQLTDARGRFILADLPTASPFSLTASKSGYFTPERPRLLSLVPGQWIQDVKIDLSRHGAISGTVVDERGEPIVGAYVRLLAQLRIAGRMNLVGGVAVKTDDRGMYRIPALPEGRYIVGIPSVQNAVPADTSTALIAGLAPTANPSSAPAEPANVDLPSGQRLFVGRYLTLPPIDAAGRPQAYPITFFPSVQNVADASVITLAPGQERGGIDFQLRPVRTWLVSGRVDGDAAAVSGLALRLMPAGLEDLGQGSEAATTLVMSDGRFAFPNVPAGQYTIDARPSVTEYQFRPAGTVSASDALPRTPGARNSGGGGGTITGAPPGTMYNYNASDRDATMWGRTTVDVAARDVTNVVVTMRRGVSITGRFQIERAGEIVPMQSQPVPAAPGLAAPGPAGRGAALPGAPAPGPATRGPAAPSAIINAEPADGSASLGILRGTVAPDNTFRIDGLLPGRYVLRFLLIGTPGGPLSLKSIMAADVDHTYLPFDASAGSDFSNVVVTLTDKTQTVSGTVSNLPPSGEAALVLAFPADRSRWSGYGFGSIGIRTVTVGGKGEYLLSLPAGDYFVVAVASAHERDWVDPAFLEAASRSATRISLDWGETKTQALRFAEIAR